MLFSVFSRDCERASRSTAPTELLADGAHPVKTFATTKIEKRVNVEPALSHDRALCFPATRHRTVRFLRLVGLENRRVPQPRTRRFRSSLSHTLRGREPVHPRRSRSTLLHAVPWRIQQRRRPGEERTRASAARPCQRTIPVDARFKCRVACRDGGSMARTRFGLTTKLQSH